MIATIDVGTNTALLLVAEVAGGRLGPRFEAERFVRLGAGVDATGRIDAAALGRLRMVLLEYRALAAAHGAKRIVVAGTSASRDARNRDELVDFVRRETGLDFEVLSGEDEAWWSFAGTVSAFDDLDGPCTVLDIGGGSTEIVVGDPREPDAQRALAYRRSIDVGAVRLTERFFSCQPPRPDEVAAAEGFVRRLLEAAAPPRDAAPLVGSAGTVTALALVHARKASWEALSPAETWLDAATVRAWRERLPALSFDEVLALEPAVMTGRADVFAAGVLVLDAVMEHLGAPVCRVSPRGLRHGLALRALRG